MKNKILFIIFLILSVTYIYSSDTSSIYDFTVVDINGNEVELSEFRNKTIMIVNVASKCGYTPQYEGLEQIYQKYKSSNFVILGFPTNDFLWQEPGTNEEIQNFCTINYGVTFPLFSKITVKGKNTEPLYKFLIDKNTNPQFAGPITWNFNKFLIDSNGNIVNRFASSTEPLSDEVITAIENSIAKKN